MVHFVGCGCGAADLITLRGKALIEKGDVIIYAGSLINPQILCYAREDSLKYNSAYMTLDEVMDVIKNAQKDDLEVVRLHSGDPSVYGAIKEQIDELEKYNIKYDITPGVSAAFGAAAALGKEYTLPGISQSLIITRMEGKTKVPDKESIESFASHRASMAIYLSAGLTGGLSERLIKGGYDEDTPCAICYKVTWDEEKLFSCTVGTLDKTAKEKGIDKTAIILVGDFLKPQSYERSRLYADDFETSFRKIK